MASWARRLESAGKLSGHIFYNYVWSIALYGAETWTLRAVDQKHLEIFEM